MLILWLFACKDPGADTANHSGVALVDPGVGEYGIDEVEATIYCTRVLSGEPYEMQEPLMDERSTFIVDNEGEGYTWTPVGNVGPFLYDRYTPLPLTKRSDGAWVGHVAVATEADFVEPAVPVFISLFVTLRPTDQWVMQAEVLHSLIDQTINEDGTLGSEKSLACSWSHLFSASREG